jgi:acid phosphatase family membrane protein YuiD
MSGTWLQFPLATAILAMLVAQFIKVPIYWIFHQRLDFGMMFTTGGMPSSHSAMVAGLGTGIGLARGWDSDLFALAAVFAIVVMYDALGIRRHAGKQATIVNQLVKDVQRILATTARDDREGQLAAKQHLKELLGHEPLEVLFGALLGIAIAVVLHTI